MTRKKNLNSGLFISLALLFLFPLKTFGETDKGIGPVTSVTLAPIDVKLATQGKEVFKTKCSACHKIGERYVGPALKDVTKRRAPEWIMNMILNPAEMTQKNPIAQELLGEFLTQMTFQNVTQDQARSILEYFRHVDEKGDLPDAPKP